MRTSITPIRSRLLLVVCCLAIAAATDRSAVAEVFTWNLDADSPWNDLAGWTPTGFPNSPNDTAILGGVISTGRTITLTSGVVVNQIVFDNRAPYTIAGTPSINGLAFAGNRVAAGIDVLQGPHQIQADIRLAVDAVIDVNPGAMLTLGAGLTLGGNQLSKTGEGELRINTFAGSVGGLLDGRAGLVSGIGTIPGNFISRLTTIAPGEGPNDVGTLAVSGDYAQQAGGVLVIEIGGAGQFDQLVVGGTASLGGTLDLRLLAGARPVPGEVYQIITANKFEEGQFFDSILGLATPEGGSFGFPFDFNLTGGIGVTYSSLKGDMNGDLLVDELDVERFAWAIRDSNTYIQRFGINGQQECDQGNGCIYIGPNMADMDRDGPNTFADIPLFVDLVNSAPGAATISVDDVLNLILAVPEPSSSWLALIGLLVLGSRRVNAN